jgi:nucleotide-binding universal stress UspA family protein
MRILLGVDADLSSHTQYALRTVCDLLRQTTPPYTLLLVTVIPLSHVMTHYPGMYSSHVLPLDTTTRQRNEAALVLRKANLLCQQLGVAPDHIEEITRVGLTADELARVAQEEQATLLVVGTHSSSLSQKTRRFLMGSISRRLLELAPCPVTIASPPATHTYSRGAAPSDLVAWYRRALESYLSEHEGILSVFTVYHVIQQFTPPSTQHSRRRQIAAATLALEQLVSDGVFCRHEVQGEIRYAND